MRYRAEVEFETGNIVLPANVVKDAVVRIIQDQAMYVKLLSLKSESSTVWDEMPYIQDH